MSRRGWCVAVWATVTLALLAACGDGEATYEADDRSARATEAHWSLVCLVKDERATVMPDVVGKGLRSAAQDVCDLGIRLGDIEGGPEATVYEQHPAAGDAVDAATRVDLEAR